MVLPNHHPNNSCVVYFRLRITYRLGTKVSVKTKIKNAKEEFLKKNKEITEYSEELFDDHVDTIKVLSRDEIQFNLRCGLVLTERL